MKKKNIVNALLVVVMCVIVYFGFNDTLYDVVLPEGLNTILLKFFAVYIDFGFGIQMLLYNMPECEWMKLIANKYKKITFCLIGFFPAIFASVITILANYSICIGYIKIYGENGEAQKTIALCVVIVMISVVILIISYLLHNKICNDIMDKVFDDDLKYDKNNARNAFKCVDAVLAVFSAICNDINNQYFELSMLSYAFSVCTILIFLDYKNMLPQEQTL